ncbi:MAG: hypothetical protein ACYC9O_09565, partial [Candidatus Latescibacterota bacterium]
MALRAILTGKISRRLHIGRCALCLLAMLVTLVGGMVMPVQGSDVRNAHGAACYGLASESADSAACLLAGKNERNSSPALARTSMHGL